MTVENNQGEEFVELMSQRRSHPRVEEPAPSDDLMQDIFAASLRERQIICICDRGGF